MGWEEKVRRVVPYIPGEQPKQKGIIKLNTNECPYPPSPLVKRKAAEFQTDELRLYPDPDASLLVKSLADYYGVIQTGLCFFLILPIPFMMYGRSFFRSHTAALC